MESNSSAEISNLKQDMISEDLKANILKVILAVSFLAIGFFLGILYQKLTLTPVIKDSASNVSLSKTCPQDTKQCPNGSYVSRIAPNCEFSACPSIYPAKKPTIAALTKAYEISMLNPAESAYLCIQEDIYSKPGSNPRCNTGIKIDNYNHSIWNIPKQRAVLKLYSDESMTKLYDAVVASGFDTGEIKLAPLKTMCGILSKNSEGNFYIDAVRLLTVPGWQELAPFVGKDACVQGEAYNESFRVYFIE